MAAMALQKPATMWVSHLPSDATFVFGLLHGVFPMAPAPAGDHSLGMSGMYTYLKYGPMMRALQGRVWNLQPHAISAYIGNTTTPAAGSAQGHSQGSRRALGEHDVAEMGPIAIQKCASPEPGAELLWTKLPARNTEGTADAGGPIRLQLHVPSSSPSTDAAPQALCLTAVATTTWCGNRDVCNDELDALACNSSDPAQLWWWNSTAQIATAMPKALKDKLWSGRPGRCNGWPCCLDVNAEKAVNGQTLQGDGCPGAQFKAVPSAGSSSAFQIQVTTFGHHATPGWCVGYQPNMPGVGIDANLFDLPDGSSVAVLALRGTTAATVTVRLARVAAEPAVKIESLQLGRTENWAPAAARDGTVQLEIRSIVAMLRIS